MKQTPNSIPNVDDNSVSPTCHNTMLSAAALSGKSESLFVEIAKINIVVGGYNVSVEITKNEKSDDICTFVANLKDNEFSKI